MVKVGKILPWFIFAMVFLSAQAWALKTTTVDRSPKAYGYLMWHDKYLLFAARVEDSMLVGTSTEPQVSPDNDDGIELCFDVVAPNGQHTLSRLVISAAGGFAVFSRDKLGRWRTDNSWLQPPVILKFASLTDGTLNNPTDKDRAFIIEAAIPWERLGATPKPMATVGFNFMVRIRGENQSFVSWSPGFITEDDNKNPTRWGALVLLPGTQPSQAEARILACPRTARVPFIDGKLGAEEWIGASILTLTKPEPEFEPSPKTTRSRDVMPMIMALYRYDYRLNHATESKSSIFPALPIHQPREALGPWWDASKPDWHLEQLRQAHRVGIDVLLAQYSPAPDARATWSRHSLAALSEALRELRATQKSYPTIGLYLDFSELEEASGIPFDLMSDQGKTLLYGAIREFYEHIPSEFRAEAGPKRGLPVLLGPPTASTNWDDGFVEFANQAFSRDFQGANLVWFADPAWKEGGGKAIEAFAPLKGLQVSSFDTSGRASVAVLTPGCDDLAVGLVRPRKSGRELREEWSRILALNPDYIILSSWNDFVSGNQIAASRQDGFMLTDAFLLLVSEEAAKVKSPLRLKKQNCPSVITLGQKSIFELVLANAAAEEIRSNEKVGLDWRLLSADGKSTFASKTSVIPFRILPGASQVLRVPVFIADSLGRPLRRGDYLIEFAVRRSSVPYFKSRWLGRDLAVFRIPVRIDRPDDYRLAVLDSTLQSSLQAGAKYEFTVTLRNDGARTWKKGETSLFGRWLQVNDDYAIPTSAQFTQLDTTGSSAALPQDVAPGEIINLSVPVETSAQGIPLQPWSPGDMWHYALQWTLEINGTQVAAVTETEADTVYVVAKDVSAYFVDSQTPREMLANTEYDIAIVLSNTGANTWDAQETSLVCHWYYWDGTPAFAEKALAQLPREVKPHDSIQLSARLKTPAYGGPYYLVWELQQGGVFASEDDAGHVSDTLRAPVMIGGGKCQSVDLSEYLNMVSAAAQRQRSSADFDGLGNCFPLEEVPPDLTGNSLDVYPAGYYANQVLSDSTANLQRITFRYPSKNAGLAKAVVCAGQTISVNSLQDDVNRIHILGTGTGAGLNGDVVVTLVDGSQDSLELNMTSWLAPPANGEAVGLAVPYQRSTRDDNARQKTYLHHYQLDLPQRGPITSLTLPKHPEMKIFAITLESTPVQESGAAE